MDFGNINVLGNIGTDVINYSATSTVIGWSSFTTKEIHVKNEGKMVYVAFNLQGTSNSASSTFTVPYTSDNAPLGYGDALQLAVNGGTTSTTATRVVMGASTTAATIYSNMSTGGWVTSGDKIVVGSFWYFAA